MVTMDLKGITWVGHVYQKFETMCLEVEEIMYQDTVKYVENQVQTVGASVKKFYSDVMQDILPPSSTDLVKLGPASDMVAEQHQEVGIHKKAKVGMKEKEKAVKVENKPLTEDSLVTAYINKNASQGASFHGFLIEDTSFQSSSENNVGGACSDLYSYNNRSMHDKLSLDGKKISREEKLHPSERSGAIIHTGKDISRTSLSYELDKNCESSCAQIALNPPPVTVEQKGFNSEEETCDEFESEKKGMPDSSPSEDCNEIENRSANSSCNGESVNAADIFMNNGVVSIIGSSGDGDVQPDKFSDEDIFVFHSGQSDDLTTGTVQSSFVVELGLETIQPIENFKVEDSCVLVNGDELHFLPHKDGKYKPYKKKIRDAITARMRSTRKREYKQLAVRYGEDVKSNQEQAGNSMPTKLVEGTNRTPSPDICESEWELL